MNLDALIRFFHRLTSGAYDPLQVSVELLLIGLSVNWCAGVLHGTRGTRLLRGLLVVLVAVTFIVRVVAGQLGWARLELLYHYFVIGLAFIALVAFQPELRRALIRAGEVRFLRRRTSSKRNAALVEAAGYLSRNKFGAIVAIQRDVGLANWAENGTQINSEVSAKLLTSLFYPKSPLHDLGVVIHENRIQAAGCQFPVAESGEVDPTLGSRHRAAIGLSMESDALVLVVSEESGAISLADRGRLTRFLSLDDLDQELEARLDGPVAHTSSWRWSLRHDGWRLARRLFVVVPLALVIWFIADQASLTTDDITVRLDITHDPTIVAVVDAPAPPVFAVKLRGPTREIEILRARANNAPLVTSWRLSGPYAHPGVSVIKGAELAELLGELPEIAARGVFVDAVEPDELRLVVDALDTVTFPIRCATGDVRVADVVIDPPQARITLKRQELERLRPEQHIIYADVQERLPGVRSDQLVTLRRVPLRRQAEGYEAVALAPAEVNVNLRVVAQKLRRRLEQIPVQLLASPQFQRRFEVEQRDPGEWLIELEVEGDAAVVGALSPEDVRAYVPLNSDQPPTTEFRSAEVSVDLPAGVSIIGPPRLVHYRTIVREDATP